jgi:hypothetical protein
MDVAKLIVCMVLMLAMLAGEVYLGLEMLDLVGRILA